MNFSACMADLVIINRWDSQKASEEFNPRTLKKLQLGQKL